MGWRCGSADTGGQGCSQQIGELSLSSQDMLRDLIHIKTILMKFSRGHRTRNFKDAEVYDFGTGEEK